MVRSTPLYLLLVLVASAAVMFPTLLNGWTNWDDHYYVLKNQFIQGLSIEKLKWIFAHQYNGNYAPLVLISYAVDFAVWGENAFGYHLTNFLLHLLNVSLVFVWMRKLTGSNLSAMFVALLFGIHPMHLEPIAWISGRKDLLYALFLLGAFYNWTAYITQKSWHRTLYVSTIVLFGLSVLSKGVAVVLPLFLLVIDYWSGREDYKRMILEKVPFLLMSLVFGIITIKAQQQTTALSEVSQIDFLQSMKYGFHALFLYIVKAIAPFNIGPLHPYPSESASQFLTICSGITAFLTLLVVFAFGWAKQNKMIVGGVVFLAVGLLPVLQFLPVGFAIVADRYTYIPYLGVFIITLEAAQYLFRYRNSHASKFIGMLVFSYLGWLGFVSFQNAPTWKNDELLWSKVIEQHPHDARAFVNRGMHYAKLREVDKAQFDFDEAVKLNPELKELHQQRGLLFQQMKRWEEAEQSFLQALKIDPSYTAAILNLALNFNYRQQRDSSYSYFNHLEKIDSTNILLYLNRGVMREREGKLKLAEEDYSKAVLFHPLDFRGYQFRGVARFKQRQFDNALNDFIAWQSLAAKADSKAERWLARTCFELGRFDEALLHAKKAEQLGGPIEADFLKLLISRLNY